MGSRPQRRLCGQYFPARHHLEASPGLTAGPWNLPPCTLALYVHSFHKSTRRGTLLVARLPLFPLIPESRVSICSKARRPSARPCPLQPMARAGQRLTPRCGSERTSPRGRPFHPASSLPWKCHELNCAPPHPQKYAEVPTRGAVNMSSFRRRVPAVVKGSFGPALTQ